MESELAFDLSPYLKIYRDSRVERLVDTDTVPPSLDEKTGVQSKDVIVSSDPSVSARIYIPTKSAAALSMQKLPVIIYFHGGAFLISSAQSPRCHNYLNAVVAQANVVVLSVDFRNAPEHPIPAAYDDCWTALKWVASHSAGNGPEEWLNSHANLNKVFLAGDSAGANIAHNMGIRLGEQNIDGVEVSGIMLVHPYFWGEEPLPLESVKPESKASLFPKFWKAASPNTTGCDDPLLNPAKDPKLSTMGCNRVLVCVAEKDLLSHRGWYYKEVLSKSGWSGAVEVIETQGEDHGFFLKNPNSDNAASLMKQLISFMNED